MNVYGTCLGLALFTGWFLWTREASRKGWIATPLLSPAPVCLLLGIVGARLVATVGEWARYGATLFAWRGPLAVQGGMLAAAGFLALWSVVRARPTLAVLDALARAFAAMLVPIRVGCFAAGCCQGKPTELWLGVADTHGTARHPTQVYELLLALVLVVLFQHPRSRAARPGTAALLFLLVYGVARAGLEVLRDDTERGFLGTSYPQCIAVAMALAGALGLLARRGARVRAGAEVHGAQVTPS
jgi:phosphatidylglycerol:prolipoprotein diacylglycerol transferase